MFMESGENKLLRTQRGITLVELMVAMLLLAMITSMLYSILNVGIKFSQKGEGRLAEIGRQRSFLELFHRQVQGVWYDKRQGRLLIEGSNNQLKMVTTMPLVERDAGLVLAVYVYDPGDEVLYYSEKLDYFNVEYGDNYSPSTGEMHVLLRDLKEIDWQYDDTAGVLAVSYLGRDYEMAPRSWPPEKDL